MSKNALVPIHCEHCGFTNSIEVWESINVTVDPHLKQQLLNGHLSRFDCEQCNFQTHFSNDLLYNDMRQNYMIWLKLPNEDGEVKFQPGALDLAEKMYPLMGLDYRLRIVTSLNCLIEKIRIFDENLNDFALEFLKMCIRHDYSERVIPENYLLFDEFDKQNNEINFVIIDEIDEEELISSSIDAYQQAFNYLDDKIGLPSVSQAKWLTVDENYIVDLF